MEVVEKDLFCLTVEYWGLPLVLLLRLYCMSLNNIPNYRWEISPANPYVLSIIGALFSTGCFYLIANTANWQPFGRFILLTYNLVPHPGTNLIGERFVCVYINIGRR